MNLTVKQVTAGRAIVDALVTAGYLPAARADAATALVGAYMPKAVTYTFTADAEFLHACLEHHVKAYFRQVLEPAAMIHHGGIQRNGRLITDKEIENATVELTSQVMGELGSDYRQHMAIYLGDERGMTTYVYSRVHAALLEAAQKFNEEYLNVMARRINAKRATT